MADRNWKEKCLRVAVPLLTVFVGVTLLFSGIVKAIDPAGMSIKLEAYSNSWGLPFTASSLTLNILAALLALVETCCGVNLVLGIRRRSTTKLTAALMLVLTLFSAYVFFAEPVADCGCFGAAAKLTNGQTLLKNCVLLPCTILIALFPLYIPRFISRRSQWITDVWTVLFIIGLTLYSLHYLPPVDFTAFREGANIRKAYWGNTENQDDIELASFYAMTPEGEDVTDSLLNAEGSLFLVTLPDMRHADDGCNDRINDLFDFAQDQGIAFYALTAGEPEAWDEWKDRTGAAYDVLEGEKSQLRSLARSNPGLVLLHNGVIRKKWSNNDLPTFTSREEIKDLSPASNRERWLKLIGAFLLPLLFFCLCDYLWCRMKVGIFRRRRSRLSQNNEKTKITDNLTKNQQKMRKKIVAGNWKMNKNLQEGIELAKELNEALTADKPNCDVVICTPFIHLASVAALLNKDVIGLGAENCADKAKGAYTGEVSAEMVKSTGADYVILGHSERRSYYAETAEILKEKVNLALENGLKVIFCIGEVLEEREAGIQNSVVEKQLAGSLFELTAEQMGNIILAYEPVWAIGTGKTATADQAQEMHAFIRATIAGKFGEKVAEDTSILYGGSCKPSNAKELFAKPDVDGGLIGGAALKAEDFKGIIDAWK